MRSFFKALLISIVLTSPLPVIGQMWTEDATNNTVPTVEIYAPDKVKNGHMVVVTAKMDRSKLPKNLIGLNYQWTVLVNGVPSNQFLVWPDGTQIVFSGSEQNSVTTVILDVDCLFGTKTVAKVGDKDAELFADVEIKSPELSTVAIIVGGFPTPSPTPNPGPNPSPAPAPSPSLPAGRYDLAKFAYQTIASDASLTLEQKVALAAGYAKAFGKVAAQIAALSNYRDVPTILKDTNTGSIQARSEAGVTEPQVAAFRKTMDDKVYELYGTKRVLRTAQDIADAWRELATGFNAYVENAR